MAETIWHKKGKTVKEGVKCIYTSLKGQFNTEVSEGIYVPYILDAGAKILKTGESKVIFTDTGIDFYFQDKLLLNVKFNLETKDITWTKDSVIVSDFKTESSDECCSMSYLLTTPNQKAIIKVKGGCSGWIDFEFEKTALKDGEQQIVLETNHTEIATDLLATFDKEKNKASYKRGVKMNDSVLLWQPHEVEYHDVFNKEDNLKTSIAIKSDVYKANDIVKVFPTTWGATSIAATADDCEETDDTTVILTGHDSDGNRLGNSYDNIHDIGLWWDNIAIAPGVTINSGCKIALYQNWANLTPDVIIKGIDEADPDIWSDDASTTRPSQRSKVAATVLWEPSDIDNAWQDTPELSTIVDDIINGGSFSNGNAIAFTLEDDGSVFNTRLQFHDYTYGSGNAAKLTIEYTSSSTLLPIIMNHQNNIRV